MNRIIVFIFLFLFSYNGFSQIKQGYIHYAMAKAFMPSAVTREIESSRYFQPKIDSTRLLNSQLDSALHFFALDTHRVLENGQVELRSDFYEDIIEKFHNQFREDMIERDSMNRKKNEQDLQNFLDSFASDGDCILILNSSSPVLCFNCKDYTQAFIDYMHKSDPQRTDSLIKYMDKPAYR